MNALLRTDDAWSSLVLRVVLGVVMFPEGAQKLFGWFGGYGFSGTMGAFTGQMHIPAVLAFLVIMAESGGPLLLVPCPPPAPRARPEPRAKPGAAPLP